MDERDFSHDLHDAADRAPVDPEVLGHALPAMRREVRRRRTIRGVGTGVVGVAAVAALAVAATALPGLLGDETPVPPATPSPSQGPTEPPTGEPTEEPTEAPTEEPTETADDAGAIVGSEPVTPVCGEPFALPDRPAQLRLDASFDEPVALPPDAGSIGTIVSVTNAGDTNLTASIPYSAQLVITDANGLVVAWDSAAYDSDGAEGSGAIGAVPGFSFEYAAGTGLYATCDDPTTGTGSLPPGDYQAYGLLSAVGIDDEDLQGQGGPWPLTVVEGSEAPDWPRPDHGGNPDGVSPWIYECGAEWQPPVVETGFELEPIDQIRTPRSVSDAMQGRWTLTSSQVLNGPAMFTQTVLVQNGTAVSEPLQPSDAVIVPYASPGGSLALWATSTFAGCDGGPLPPGDYELYVVALTNQGNLDPGDDASPYVAVVSDVQSITIE